MTCRPDIAFTVGQVAKFCQNSVRIPWKAVRKIISYLSGTIYTELCFQKSDTYPIVGYTDADFGGELDSRCSTSRYAFFIYGNLVSWSNKTQKCVSQSTTEAEYVAASESSKEAVLVKNLFPELIESQQKPVSIFCDNQSAIKSVYNSVFPQRTKHIDIKYYFIRSLQENRVINVSFVPSREQRADIFTKPLPNAYFYKMFSMPGLLEFNP